MRSFHWLLAGLVLALPATIAHGDDPECALPDTGGELVNTGMPTCSYSGCDTIVGRELLFGCFPEQPNRPSLCSHDLSTRETRVVASGWPHFLDGVTTLEVYEAYTGEDFNGDGDLADVHFLARREPGGRFRLTGVEYQTRSGWPFYLDPRSDGPLLAFDVSELSLEEDRNGDGDMRDRFVMLHVMGFEGTLDTQVEGEVISVVGNRVWIETEEQVYGEATGVDLNGDGDTDDDVLRFLEIELPDPLPARLWGRPGPNPITADRVRLVNTATDRGSSLIEAGERMYWAVDESRQGRDLNGDGDTDDRVLHGADAGSDEIVNSGIVGSPVGASLNPERIALLGPYVDSARTLYTWEPESGRRVEHGRYSLTEQAGGDRVLLWTQERGHREGELTVFDIRTGKAWFAGYTGHVVAARLSGDYVALHRDAGDCYGGVWLASVVEFVDYRRGSWKTTGIAGHFYSQPSVYGPVIPINSSEYLADRDWDGDGLIEWPQAVQVYWIMSDFGLLETVER